MAEADPKEILKQGDTVVESLVSGSRQLIGRLEKLAPEEKDIVASLMAVSQMVGAYAWSRGRSDSKVTTDFYDSVHVLSPRIIVPERGDTIFPCMDELIAHAIALAKCHEDESKTEEECDKEAGPEGSLHLACILREIAALKGNIFDLTKVRFPPGPQPPFAGDETSVRA